MAAPLRILVVDDHSVVRKGLGYILQHGLGGVALTEAADAEAALAALDAAALNGGAPDLVISDISLPGQGGLELAKQVLARWPDLPVLFVSRHDESLFARRALETGARGYVMKHEADEAIVEAVRCVLDGRVYVSPSVRGQYLADLAGIREAETPLERLSDRELEVFEYIGRGMARAEIAHALNLSVKTVESYRSRIKEKLGLDSAARLVQSAVQWVQSNS